MSFKKNYSAVDKALHYLAFSVPTLRILLNDIENSLYKKELASFESQNEVFISGLPRSGTTLLLEFLAQTGEFHTFSYRHMPFIYSPLLWRKLSNPFAKKGKTMERAHGDGMKVTLDSPEAFEEVIWLNHLKAKFVAKDRLIPLSLKNTSLKFAKHFQTVIKKLLIESNKEGKNLRYISKNNANCSRISVIKKIFPTSTILLPFREPLAHIGSLMKQHAQFSEMHQDDKFGQNYMRWLGHFDFGANFKPIDFDHWLNELESPANYQDENFWLSYWIAAYSNIIENQQQNVYLVDYDKLLSSPKEVLTNIADKLKLKAPSRLVSCSDSIRSPTSKSIKTDTIQPKLVQKAVALHRQLQEAAI